MKQTFYSFLCMLVLTVSAHGAAGYEMCGSWIWHPDTKSGYKMPAGKRYFRKSIDIPKDKKIAKAVFNLSADNDFVLYVNGKKIGSDDNWTKVSSFDLRKSLIKDQIIIAVEARNGETGSANPAGLIGTLRIDFEKGTSLVIATDSSWKSSNTKSDKWETIAFNDSEWSSARALGPYGCAPWKAFAGSKISKPAEKRHSGFDEPETRTLAAEEGSALLKKEWIFQAEGKPLAQRAIQEITWAREMVDRLKKSSNSPDLSAELDMLAKLENNSDHLQPDDLYIKVREVKRQIMFKDPLVDFSKLVFIDAPERYPHESMHRVYPQAQLNCVRLLVLDGLHPAGKVRKLTPDLGPGWYWRPDISHDAKKVLFCFRPEKDTTFHLYECNLDGSNLKQLTDGHYDDQDPVYMPDGKIVFVSNRGHSYARCVVGHPSTVVARCDPDGKNIYLISAGNEPEYTPAIMPNGQILYTRWEYTDKELMRIQSLWTVNPDGTGTSAFWGNQSYWPDLLMEARPIPGSHRVMFGGHGHHQVYMGSIGIIDPRKGFDYPNGLTKVTQDVRWAEVGDGPADKSGATRETDKYHTSGAYRGYKSPYPLSEELFLVSARHDPKRDPFKLFLMDVYGNRELIYEGAFHALYAIPVRPRTKEPVIPDRVEWAGPQKDHKKIKPGILYCQDVYEDSPEILRGKARYLRVIQQEFNTMTLGKKIQDAKHTSGINMHVGPVVSLVVNDSIKYVLGYVPIEKDGSVSFEAPPCVPLHFQLLDENHRALHTMRSFTNLMPGEFRGCVGCHEGQNKPPAQTRSIAVGRKPLKITPYSIGPKYSIGYEHDIQPILDKNCGSCHQGDKNPKARKKIDLTLRPSHDGGIFPEPYIELTLGKKRRLRSGFPLNCEGGIAGTILAQPRPWKPKTYKTFPPMTALSYKSRLIDIAISEECGQMKKEQVDKTSLEKLILWVDTLCTYRSERELRAMADPDPEDPVFKRSSYPPSDPTVKDVYAESPYRPRMRTAPIVNRAYRQDDFPTTESRLPRNKKGEILPTVSFTPEGKRVELSWDGERVIEVDEGKQPNQ
jgi:hypothetical protein